MFLMSIGSHIYNCVNLRVTSWQCSRHPTHPRLSSRHPTPNAPARDTTRWRHFLSQTTDYLDIGAHDVQMKRNFRTARIKFWNELIPSVKRRIEQLRVAPRVLSGSVWPLRGAVIALLLLLFICIALLFRMRLKARSRRHQNAVPTRL